MCVMAEEGVPAVRGLLVEASYKTGAALLLCLRSKHAPSSAGREVLVLYMGL
jgi:hypothetical protein